MWMAKITVTVLILSYNLVQDHRPMYMVSFPVSINLGVIVNENI